jgi:TAZ zinc finger
MDMVYANTDYDTRHHLSPSYCKVAIDDSETMMHSSTLAASDDAYRTTSYPDHDRYQYQHMSCKRDPSFQKQKRLKLLCHSAQCQNMYCTRTHCSKLKELWIHMEHCMDDKCGVPHCLSSRCLLAHCRKCQNMNCTICVPVRVQANRTPLYQQYDNRQNYTNNGQYPPPAIMSVAPCLTDEADDVCWT